jgi:hypothetical protein
LELVVSLLVVVLICAALIAVVAMLVAAGAAKLARMDGATYPTAIMVAAVTFAAVITLAAGLAQAVSAVLS